MSSGPAFAQQRDSAAAAVATRHGSPFNVRFRKPELANRLHKFGEVRIDRKAR
jgi:hypothetical protein